MQPTLVTIQRNIFHQGRLCAQAGEVGYLFDIFFLPRENPDLGWPLVGRVKTPLGVKEIRLNLLKEIKHQASA